MDKQYRITREEAIQILADLIDSPFLHTWEKQNKALHMAIEALSEPINCVKCKHYYETEDDTDVHGHCKMNTAHTNLISRVDALKPFCTTPDGTRIPEVDCDNFPVEFSVEFIKKHLLSLPSFEADWVPVSERLPERDELVLVTYKTTDKIHLCKYIDDGSENSWWSYIDDCCACNNVVIAWMPLPKPYKGGDTE